MKPLKSPKGWTWESFWTGEYRAVLGDWCIYRRHGRPSCFPHILPYALFPCGCSWVISFFKKTVIRRVKSFLTFVSCSGKLMEPKEGGGHGNLWCITSWSETQVTGKPIWFPQISRASESKTGYFTIQILGPPLTRWFDSQTWAFNWYLKWVDWVGLSCGTEPITWGFWCYFQVDSVRIGSNCRAFSWCPENCLVVMVIWGNRPMD